MPFSLAILALPVLAAATAVPRGGASKCNSGPVQCCNTLVDTKDKHQTNIVGALLGLDLGSLTGLAGVNCSPVQRDWRWGQLLLNSDRVLRGDPV
nr:1G2 protein [Schizophyllum commune]